MRQYRIIYQDSNGQKRVKILSSTIVTEIFVKAYRFCNFVNGELINILTAK